MESSLQIIGSFSECFWRLIFGKNWRASPRKNANLQLESSLNTRHHWGPQIFGIIICFNKDLKLSQQTNTCSKSPEEALKKV